MEEILPSDEDVVYTFLGTKIICPPEYKSLEKRTTDEIEKLVCEVTEDGINWWTDIMSTKDWLEQIKELGYSDDIKHILDTTHTISTGPEKVSQTSDKQDFVELLHTQNANRYAAGDHDKFNPLEDNANGLDISIISAGLLIGSTMHKAILV